jgi:hypothetical protein
MKLISMTDLVIERCNEKISFMTPMEKVKRAVDAFNEIINYANFLKQPLTLGMFVPCDENGNVLEEPKEEDYFDSGFNLEFNQKHFKDVILPEYQQAKERVLFEGVSIKEFGRVIITNSKGIENTIANANIKKCIPNWTIETLINWEITLTESAIKQLGL